MTDTKTIIRALIKFISYLILNPLVLFLSAGTARWPMAWAYFIVAVLAAIVSRVLARRKHPDLLAERAKSQQAEGIKPWDKVLLPISALYGPLLTMIVAGLDKRFGWTDAIPLWLQITALGLGILGYAFATWAMVENRYFSAVVRIQEDRDHAVCKSGPYRFIRHPGYAGGLVWYLVTPLILNSLWAYLPTVVSVVATVVRTYLEDQTLQEELDGYKAYTQETRYRLVPGVW
jgi:protein-S-isoprenylcysteine O-methyltransferase Ste14